ncbi:MAG: hypothetical protein HN348_07420 [Proteobacteria bacterium]|nr:hypothetical protein [Pseudomonadota bacterium]
MSDIDIHPTEHGVYAAAELNGAVWLSLDGGVSWLRLLNPLAGNFGPDSNDEDILLEVETRIEDLVGDIEDPSEFEVDEGEDSVDEIQSMIGDAAEQVRSELRSDPWFLEQEEVMKGRPDVARPRVWFTEDGRLFVGRADGLYHTTDLGQTWELVLDVAVTSLAHLASRGLWVAGTQDGVRFSTDAMEGSFWIDAEDGTEGIHIFDLTAAEEGIYAGTSDGLWLAHDAQTWRKLGVDDAILSVHGDPDWELGLWFGTKTNVQRSDDGGLHWRPTLGAPLHSMLDMIRVGPGHLLAVTADGPWESMDGGTSWLPLVRGLSDPDCRGLTVRKSLVLLASDEGVFRAEPAQERGPEDEEFVMAKPQEWIPIGILLDEASTREGLVAAGKSRRVWASALPQVTLDAVYSPEPPSLHYNAGIVSGGFDAGTSQDRGGDFRANIRLRWTPLGRHGSYSTGEGDVERIHVLIGNDGEVYVDDGTNPHVMEARLNRRATVLRQNLASQVTDLYFARAELIEHRPRMTETSLHDQIDHELLIQELEAQLNILTDGAVSRWENSHQGG